MSSAFNTSVAVSSVVVSFDNVNLLSFLLQVANSARRNPNVFIEPPCDFESQSTT